MELRKYSQHWVRDRPRHHLKSRNAYKQRLDTLRLSRRALQEARRCRSHSFAVVAAGVAAAGEVLRKTQVQMSRDSRTKKGFWLEVVNSSKYCTLASRAKESSRACRQAVLRWLERIWTHKSTKLSAGRGSSLKRRGLERRAAITAARLAWPSQAHSRAAHACQEPAPETPGSAPKTA